MRLPLLGVREHAMLRRDGAQIIGIIWESKEDKTSRGGRLEESIGGFGPTSGDGRTARPFRYRNARR
jgi:hypothetical protein